MKKLKYCFLQIMSALLLLLCFGALAAEDMPFSAKYLQIEYNDGNGLLSQEANSVLHTSDGYIWI